MRILVVEDDQLLNKTLSYNLSAVGYSVDGAMSKAVAIRFLEKQGYDLIVLDVNLPDGNGFDICREVKERRPDTAVIFLTANDMESDMLKGFELGADDYVTKPFPISVFQKKVSALLNRISAQSGGDFYDDGNLYINFSELSACLAGQPITLTSLEYRLLKVLTRNSQTVLTRQVLLEKLWDADENYVDEHALLWSSFFVTLVAKKIVLINLCCRPCFIWGSITIITVWTNMIIINVCKFFYLLIECFLCCKLIQICAFILQGIEVTLHRCIVVRISCFAHALCHIYRFAEFGKCFGRIL